MVLRVLSNILYLSNLGRLETWSVPVMSMFVVLWALADPRVPAQVPLDVDLAACPRWRPQMPPPSDIKDVRIQDISVDSLAAPHPQRTAPRRNTWSLPPGSLSPSNLRI